MQTTDKQTANTDISATEQSRVPHAASAVYQVLVDSRWLMARTTDLYGRPQLFRIFDVKWKSSRDNFVTLAKGMLSVASTTTQVVRIQSSAQMPGISDMDAMPRRSRPYSCMTGTTLSVDSQSGS